MKSALLICFLFFYTIVQAQDVRTYDSELANKYFDFSLKLVKETPGFTPPIAARAFGYMGLTLYEALVPGIPGRQSTAGILNELNDLTLPSISADYHWPTVANNAMSTILDSLFRTMTLVNKDSLINLRDQYNALFQYQVSPQVFEDSKAFGEAIGLDIFEYSRLDGGHTGFSSNFPASYIPPVGEEHWAPYGMQVAMLPYWGSNRPFVAKDSTIIAEPPMAFSTEPGTPFYEAAYEVYNTSLFLTPEETTIAQYWADGGGSITPGGHSISILKNILTDENANLEEATIAYAKLGIALSDAFLVCWKTKYIYNLCRPVTYIRSHIDSNWLPLIGTPPFPEYTSGHSTQSGAMAGILEDIYGSSFSFTDHTHGNNFGGPRSFASFDDAAEEAAISRLYGGIHYRFSNLAGLEAGQEVAGNVNDLFDQLNVATEWVGNSPANISVYPNPAIDFVSFKSDPDLIGSDFSLIDVNGIEIMSGKIVNEITTLSLGQQSPGLYLLQVENDVRETYRVAKN